MIRNSDKIATLRTRKSTFWVILDLIAFEPASGKSLSDGVGTAWFSSDAEVSWLL